MKRGLEGGAEGVGGAAGFDVNRMNFLAEHCSWGGCNGRHSCTLGLVS